MITVYVATWTTTRGSETRVFATQASAERWRQQIAKERWDDLIDPAAPMPDAPATRADRFFELRKARDESFDVADYPVED